jgi:hypothetical protein
VLPSNLEEYMLRNKIKKIKGKKLLFYPFILLFVITVSLAFIPHYSCACGEIKVRNGSILSHTLISLKENIKNAFK